MNLSQLKKNVGQKLRLRPQPTRIDINGGQLPPSDEPWVLDAILTNPNRVRLTDTITKQIVELESDNVKQYQSPEFLLLRSQLTVLPQGIRIEPVVPAPALKHPVPIARYQLQKTARAIRQYVAVRPEICDGCTAVIEFRTASMVGLPAHGGEPATEERLCPRCARIRGITIQLPRGMERDVLYAETNPSFLYHVSRLLDYPVLPSLSQDATLRQRGVSNVGAATDQEWLTLIVSGPTLHVDIDIKLAELQRHDIRSEFELVDYFRNRILERIERVKSSGSQNHRC